MLAAGATCRNYDTGPSTKTKVSLPAASVTVIPITPYLVSWIDIEDARRAEVEGMAVVLAEVA